MRCNPSPPTSAALLAPPSDVRKTVILLFGSCDSGISNCIHPGRARDSEQNTTLWTTNVPRALAFWVRTEVVWSQVHFALWEVGVLQAHTRQRFPLELGVRSSAEFLRGVESCVMHSYTLVLHVGCDGGEDNKWHFRGQGVSKIPALCIPMGEMSPVKHEGARWVGSQSVSGTPRQSIFKHAHVCYAPVPGLSKNPWTVTHGKFLMCNSWHKPALSFQGRKVQGIWHLNICHHGWQETWKNFLDGVVCWHPENIFHKTDTDKTTQNQMVLQWWFHKSFKFGVK